MAKNLKKALSLLLALSMCMSLLSVTALATEEEGESTTPSTETLRPEFSAPTGSGDGSADAPKLNIDVGEPETTTDENGNKTTTTTTEKTWTGKDPQDPEASTDTDDKETPAEAVPGPVTEVKGQETTVEGTVTDAGGKPLKDFGSVSGSETKTTTTTTTGETKTENKGTDTTTSTVEVSSSTSTSAPVNAGNAAETDPITSDAENAPSIDYSGISVDVTPSGIPVTKTITGTLTPAEKAEALAKLGATATEIDTTTEETVTDDDGNKAEVTTVVTETENDDGSVTYTKTVTTRELTPESEDSSSSSTSITDGETGTKEREQTGEAEVTKKATVTPPAKPEDKADVTNEDGSVTKTTVVEINEVVENGGDDEQLVGYKVITTTVDKNGKTLSTQTKSIYGTITTETTETRHFQQETVTKEEVTTVTTKVYKQTVETSTSTVGVSSGELSVTMGDVNVKTSQTDIKSLQPDSTLRPSNGQVNAKTDLYGRYPDTPTDDQIKDYSDDYQYRFEGNYGLDSSILVKADYIDENGDPQTGTGWWAHQFKLSKNGSTDTFYAYCADFTTSANEGSVYNMINVEDAAYFKNDNGVLDKEKAEKVRTIALNGYWGTAAGEEDANGNYATGSLKQLKKQLKSADGWTDDEITAITDGIALTATQAAIWKYGNSGSYGIKDGDVAGSTVGGCDTSSPEAKNLVNKLYGYLISLEAKSATENTALLGADSIKSSTVSLNSKVNDDSYNTDISFTLAVTPSSKSADSLSLTLTYTDSNGQTQTVTKKLNAADDAFSGSTDGTYTFKGLNIKNGENVQLTLNGVHMLDQGVYLYSAPTYDGSQTFVGVGEGRQTVDISTSLTIEVTDPTASITEKSSEQEQEVTETSTKKDIKTTTVTKKADDITVTTETVDQTKWEWESEWEKLYHYSSSGDDDDEDPTVSVEGEKTWVYDENDDTATSLIPESITVNLLADGKLTDSTTVKADKNGNWKYSFTGLPEYDHGNKIVYTVQEVVVEGFTATYDGYNITNTYTGKTTEEEKSGDDDDNIPDGGTPSTGIPSLDIPDDVPTANVPKTGDASVIWYVLSACSGLGLAGTALLGRKRRDEDDI